MVTRSVEVDMKLDSLKGWVDELFDKFEEQKNEKQAFFEEHEKAIHKLNQDLNTTNKRLIDTLTSMSHTDEKVLAVESYFGVITQRLDNIESYRDFKEKKREKQIQKIKMIIQATLIALSIFIIGYCCGVLQWK